MEISIAEWGLGFVLENFRRFQGEGVFFLFFAAAVAVLLFAVRTEWKKGFMWYLLCLFLLVFNPLLATPVVEVLGLEDEYYRLIWLLPVTVLLAWLAVWIVEKGKKGWIRAALCLVCMLLLAVPGKSVLASGLKPAENLYKISDEIIEISEKLHRHSGSEELNVVTDFDLVVVLNQYDPSLHLVLPYLDVSLMREYEQMEDYETSLPPNLQSQMNIYQMLYNQKELPWMELGGAFNYTKTEYVVLKKTDPMLSYVLTQSCEIVEETENYYIMEFIPFVWDIENLKPIYE